MTTQEFADKFKVKSVATVEEWIKEGLLPAAKVIDGEICIPESTRKPNTGNRAKYPKSKGGAIIKSILNACDNRYYICGKLYGLSDADFQNVVDGLVSEDFITAFEADGVTYYNITFKGEEKLHKWSKKIADSIAAMVPNLPTILVTVAQMGKS